MNDVSETARLLESVPGGKDLVGLFSGALDFGDAEIVALDLDREGPSALVIKVCNTAQPALVTFALGHWIDVQLMGFSHQNVIGGLTLRRTTEREAAPWELGVGFVPGKVEIELKPCFGANGVIRANLLSVSVQNI
jgi:hypothetical protein